MKYILGDNGGEKNINHVMFEKKKVVRSTLRQQQLLLRIRFNRPKAENRYIFCWQRFIY